MPLLRSGMVASMDTFPMSTGTTPFGITDKGLTPDADPPLIV